MRQRRGRGCGSPTGQRVRSPGEPVVHVLPGEVWPPEAAATWVMSQLAMRSQTPPPWAAQSRLLGSGPGVEKGPGNQYFNKFRPISEVTLRQVIYGQTLRNLESVNTSGSSSRSSFLELRR